MKVSVLVNKRKKRKPINMFNFSTCTVHILLFPAMTNKCTIVICFIWVIPRRLGSNSQRFGTLYRFHLHGQVDEE